MPDQTRELAEDLVNVCTITLTRGLALRRDEREEVELALQRAREVLAGTHEPDPLAAMRDWCERHGHPVHAGDRVTTSTAAAVLGVTSGHLRNYRGDIPFRRLGRRCWYSLGDLACHVASCPSAGTSERMGRR